MSGVPRSENSRSPRSKRPATRGGQPPSPVVQEFLPGLGSIAKSLKAALNIASRDPGVASILHHQVDMFVTAAAIQTKDRCKVQELLNQTQHNNELLSIKQQYEEELLECKRKLAWLHCRQLLEVIAGSVYKLHIDNKPGCLADVQDEKGQMGSFRQVLQHVDSVECVCNSSKQLLNDLQEVNTSRASHAYSELSAHTLGGGDGGVLYVLKDSPSLPPNLKHALQVVKRVASMEHVAVELV